MTYSTRVSLMQNSLILFGTQVVKMPPAGGDSFPPSQVRDLDIMVNDSSHITLTWTAPGDDLDSGIGKVPSRPPLLSFLTSYFIFL